MEPQPSIFKRLWTTIRKRNASPLLLSQHGAPSQYPGGERGTTLLQRYGLVRVIQLRYPLDAYDGWRINRRPPAVGDMGTIVEILHAPGLPSKYVVESSDADGITIWLDDFDAEEIEPIDDTEYMPQHVAPELPDTNA